jgi:hypothetical protein
MTFFDLQPFDPYEARFKLIATLFLLSELSVIGDREAHPDQARASDCAKTLPSKRTALGGSRLVRPPRSC